MKASVDIAQAHGGSMCVILKDEGVSIEARRISKNNATHRCRQLVALEFHDQLWLALAGFEFIVVSGANCVDFIRLARGAPRVRHS